MLSPAKVESAVQKLLPTLRDGTKAKKFIEMLERAPTAYDWMDSVATEIADNISAEAEELEEQVKAAIVIGMLIGEEAANVRID